MIADWEQFIEAKGIESVDVTSSIANILVIKDEEEQASAIRSFCRFICSMIHVVPFRIWCAQLQNALQSSCRISSWIKFFPSLTMRRK